MEDFPDSSYQYQEVPRRRTAVLRIALGIVILVVVSLMWLGSALFMEKPLSQEVIVSIPSGTSVISASHALQDAGVIRHPRLFQLGIMILDRPVVAGDYKFDQSTSLATTTMRVAQGLYGEVTMSLVIPEGSTIADIARITHARFPHISEEEILDLGQGKEGYWYPDTYFFFPTVTATEIAQTLEETFERKTADLAQKFAATPHSKEDSIIMASIIEKEAWNDQVERQTIAGILWKRIAIDMPLQVDATFVYSIGKGSAELTRKDLTTDGPYNTYTNRGLPPTPIGNPGRASILAALEPIDSPYLFYLHGKDGTVRYARTHDEHVANKQQYLR